MDALLGFLTKLVEASPTVGAVLFVFAIAVGIARRLGLPIDTSSLFSTIVVVGIFGGSIVLVSFGKWIWKSIVQHRSQQAEYQKRKNFALGNLAVIHDEEDAALAYLRANDMQRFLAPSNNRLLNQMEHSAFLDFDDPNLLDPNIYFKVPDYVWEKIKVGRAPKTPPWETPPFRIDYSG